MFAGNNTGDKGVFIDESNSKELNLLKWEQALKEVSI